MSPSESMTYYRNYILFTTPKFLLSFSPEDPRKVKELLNELWQKALCVCVCVLCASDFFKSTFG